MITGEQYNELLPHKEDLLKFQETKSCRNHDLMIITDKIRQRHGMGAINYGCDGCKIQALIEIYHMFIEYENAKP